MKICSKCGVEKCAYQFNKRVSASDGLTSACKSCDYKKLKAWRKKNRQKWLDYVKNRYYKNKASGKLSTLHSCHPIQRAIYRRKTRYGITQEQLIGRLEKQKHKCAICRLKFGHKNMFVVDHCHDSKLVRGLLCRNCNLGIGGLIHNIENLKRAIKYLRGKAA